MLRVASRPVGTSCHSDGQGAHKGRTGPGAEVHTPLPTAAFTDTHPCPGEVLGSTVGKGLILPVLRLGF